MWRKSLFVDISTKMLSVLLAFSSSLVLNFCVLVLVSILARIVPEVTVTFLLLSLSQHLPGLLSLATLHFRMLKNAPPAWMVVSPLLVAILDTIPRLLASNRIWASGARQFSLETVWLRSLAVLVLNTNIQGMWEEASKRFICISTYLWLTFL